METSTEALNTINYVKKGKEKEKDERLKIQSVGL